MERFSNQSDQYVQSIACNSSTYVKWFGFHDFTLKDVIKIFFTLLIPTMIGILAVVLQQSGIHTTQKNRENDLLIATLQRESDEQQAQIIANNTLFTDYVKTMADIILNSSNELQAKHFSVIRALTANILRQVDVRKKRLIVQYLYDTSIIQREANIFDSDTPIADVKDLKGSILDEVDLGDGLQLTGMSLRSVTLKNATFANSDFQGSDFSNSVLTGVDFSGANLDRVKFINTQLQMTDFSEASVQYTRFIQTNLSQSTITNKQIAQALFIFNTILPNGTYARNKTFLINGDAKQGTNGWNITSGFIETKDLYFTGNNNSTMFQRINTTDTRFFGERETFQYYLSFLVHEQQYLIIQLIHLNKKLEIQRIDNITNINSSSCNNIPPNSLRFCYWSYCGTPPDQTDFIDLKFIFGYNNELTNPTAFTVLKDIEFTMTAE